MFFFFISKLNLATYLNVDIEDALSSMYQHPYAYSVVQNSLLDFL